MACLITRLTILIYILQSTNCHIVRDNGQHTENFFSSLSFNLENEAHNQESIDEPININFQYFLKSLPSEVDDGSPIASALNDKHGLRLARSSNQDFLNSLTNEVEDRTSIASAPNDQHGLRLTRSSDQDFLNCLPSIDDDITFIASACLRKSGHSSDGLECYFSYKNNTLDVKNNKLDESHLAESEYWKTCTKTTTTLYDESRKITTVEYGGVPKEYDTGCSTIENAFGIVYTTCFCNWDGCNPATNQAMFSSILMMTLPAVILVTPMVHARFI